uniref:Uncharacterized protein n=1 Tax=Oryza punctata TaxID=4537 RepID=A0A0E0KYY6_ORYPU
MSDSEHSQPQPIRSGKVYPPSAADHHQARHMTRLSSSLPPLPGTKTVAPSVSPPRPTTGKRVVTATGGGKMMAKFTVPVLGAEVAEEIDAVTIGEALQVSGMTFRMIQARRPHQHGGGAGRRDARYGAVRLSRVIPGCVAAAMPQATEVNMRHRPDDDFDADWEKINKTTMLRDVVGGATEVLPVNKVATRENTDKVATAAAQNDWRYAGGDRELTRSVQS